MKLNDGTIKGSQEANQILDEMDDDDISEDAMEWVWVGAIALKFI